MASVLYGAAGETQRSPPRSASRKAPRAGTGSPSSCGFHSAASNVGLVISCPWMRIDPESGFCKPDDQLQQHAFAGSAAPQHRQSFPAANRQIDPVETFCAPKDLCKPFSSNEASTAVVRAASRHSRGVWPLSVASRRDCLARMHHGKNTRINLHQNDIGQNDKKGRQHHRTRRRTPHAFGAALRCAFPESTRSSR